MESLPLPIDSAGEPSKGQEKHQFRIRVRDTYYIMVKTLANHGPADGAGRLTRIFSAYKQNGNPDELLVIKDCWVEATRPTEHEISQSIKADIIAFDWDKECAPPIPNVKNLVNYDGPVIDPRYATMTGEERLEFFVSIIDGMKVSVDDRNDIEDNTQEVIAHGYKFADTRDMYMVCEEYLPSTVEDSARSLIWCGTVGDRMYLPQQIIGRFFHPIVARAHHRSVMAKGPPLCRIEDAATAFSTASDASYAVFMLHCIGWLHRDISGDNILQMSSGRGVLADLEYAKLANDPLTSNFRTGTPDCMAVEVAMRYYLTGEDDESNPFDHEDDSKIKYTSLSWRFRDIHDLEWLCLRLLLRHTTNLDTRQPNGTPYAVQHPGEGAFSPAAPLEECDAQRFDDCALCDGYSFKKQGKALHPGFWWMVHDMCLACESIEGNLVRLSQEQEDQLKAENDTPDKTDVAQRLDV
ncbi:hypothetical protein BD626DRAFT_627425 [Schizophyllum amplum]|uniref:Fungal-type protein kinase domain-containing protein n=1 Tax=Schizophyllum amplum TaxID=97359 RepID=A0A550CQF9_9AGAR|nr:hypothetical protein BD626DRAFT_627425 [Auriculariopsis ampla]